MFYYLLLAFYNVHRVEPSVFKLLYSMNLYDE